MRMISRFFSHIRAKFTVYEMEDFCHGGIGDVKCEFECDVDECDLEGFIEQRVRSMASRQEQEEFDARRLERAKEIEADIHADMQAIGD